VRAAAGSGEHGAEVLVWQLPRPSYRATAKPW
jgi:hypothetical protein